MWQLAQHAGGPWCRSWTRVAGESSSKVCARRVSEKSATWRATVLQRKGSDGSCPHHCRAVGSLAKPSARKISETSGVKVSRSTLRAIHRVERPFSGVIIDAEVSHDVLETLEASLEALALSQAQIGREVLKLIAESEAPSSDAGGKLNPSSRQDTPPRAEEGEIDPHNLWHALRGNPLAGVPGPLLRTILERVEPYFAEPTALIDIAVPSDSPAPKIVLVGDTHGQMNDVLWIFHRHGPPSPSTLYIFNGDIADRGASAVEIFAIVLAFKVKYPDRVFLLRGNHEHYNMNDRPFKMGGGFADECREKHGNWLYNQFQRLFAKLPLFAIIANEVFVVHAGLPRCACTLEELRKVTLLDHFPAPRSSDEIKQGVESTWNKNETIVFDAQWADPHEGDGIRPSKRGGDAIRFGADITEKFLKDSGLKLIVRSHEVAPRRKGERPPGAFWGQGGQLLTIFSASNYGGVYQNLGAVGIFRKRLEGDLPDGSIGVGELMLELDSYFAPPLARIGMELCEERTHQASIEKVLNTKTSAKRVSSLDEPNILLDKVPEQLLHYAVGIICMNRERLWSFCNKHAENGRIDIEDLSKELSRLCHGPGLPWEWLLRDESIYLSSNCTPDYMGLKIEPIKVSINFEKLLSRFYVHWPILDKFESIKAVNQLNELMDKVLFAELSLQEAKSLFDVDSNGMVTMLESRSVMRRLLPKLSERQVFQIFDMLGDVWKEQSSIPVERFLAALQLNFGRRAPPHHHFLAETMPKMMTMWSEIELKQEIDLVTFGEQVFKEFQEMDDDANGFLEKEELIQHFHRIFPMAELGFNKKMEERLFEYLDETQNGNINAFELYRGVVSSVTHYLEGQKMSLSTSGLPLRIAEDMFCSFNSLIDSYAPVILCACRKWDMRTNGRQVTGVVPRNHFMSVVQALLDSVPQTETLGPFEMQLEILGRVLPEDVRYADVLEGFEIIDSDH